MLSVIFVTNTIPLIVSDINECTEQLDQCADGSTCLNTAGSYTCICTSGWTGSLCNIGQLM